MSKFARIGNVLGKADYDWLVEENADLADAIEEEVLKGASPDDIGRYVRQCIGEHRVGTIRRCVGAARYVKQLQHN